MYDTTRAHTTTRVLSRPAGSARPGEDENGRDSDRPEDGPWLVVFDDFLTLSEADRLVELAGQELPDEQKPCNIATLFLSAAKECYEELARWGRGSYTGSG